jgi:hypothetical protein
MSLDKLTFTPDKAAYQVGDTITVTMSVANHFLSDNWSITGASRRN